MIILDFKENSKYVDYKPYKNQQFNKKLEKAKTLIKSIDQTSLKQADKDLLKRQIKYLF